MAKKKKTTKKPTKPKVKNILVNVVLDESGSMGSVLAETIQGLNHYIKSLKEGKDSKKVSMSLTKFNTEVNLINVCTPINDMPFLTAVTYTPNGYTALFDAIGQSVKSVEEHIKLNKLNPKKDTQILFVIQTDGQENASKEYNKDRILKLVEDKKAEGWTFVFLGADMDAFALGAGFGIAQGSTLSYKSNQTKGMYDKLIVSTMRYCSNDANIGATVCNFFGGTTTGDKKDQDKPNA